MIAPRQRLVFLSLVPSPYQRDVFRAIAARARVDLSVIYLENAAPDSPWPATALAPWEQVLPGFTAGRGQWRSHFNWPVPKPRTGETWVVNGAMTDFTTQWFIRRAGRQVPWYFWGERPSLPRTAWKRWIQARQYSPLGSARAIVAVGGKARSAYARLVPGVPVFNQPYACRLEEFAQRAALRPATADVLFLFCGQMIARKGIDLLLQAFAQLVRAGAPGRLELIGREAELPGFLGALDETVRGRITYRGFLPPDELPAAFGRADVFVLPSRQDGWGVVVNQALGAGLPVVSSDAVGAAHDLIDPGKSGLIVPAGDVNALAAAMRQLAESAELRTRLGAAATARARDLSPEKAAAFWEDLVEHGPRS